MMKKNKTAFIAIAVVLAVMLIAGLFFVLNNSHVKLNKQLKLGNKYLSEANYDSAIASFDEAIAVDPMCVEAYLGLIEAYQGKGDDVSALEVAKKGYEVTKDERLNDWVKQLEEKTKKVEAEKVEEPEDEFVDGVIIPISELFNCPTICGVPWREAGGAEGMRTMMPPMTEWDASIYGENYDYYEENIVDYEDNIAIRYDYSILKDGAKWINATSNFKNGEEIVSGSFFYYLEGENGEFTLWNSYSFQNPSCQDVVDGFYNYMVDNGFTIDEIVSNLGVNIEKLKSSHESEKYKSNMGEIVVKYEQSDDYGDEYEFAIYDEQKYSLELWEQEYENENRIWILIRNDEE